MTGSKQNDTHAAALKSLNAAIAPRSVAIIGASQNPNKIGGRPIAYMLRYGFKGPIYPINPTRDEIQGLKSYPSLDALPEVPELAIIAVAGEGAVAALDECAARGVKVAIMVASGFGEIGAEGRKVQDGMVARVRAAGMRMIGPNTQGLANFGTGAVCSFSTMFTEMGALDGPVAVLSQSGAMSAMIYGLVRDRGLGVRHAHATGNEADVNVADLAWAVAQDPGVKLMLLYLETISDPAMLARAAEFARSRDLPIVAVKAGRSASGQTVASSHTGALANEDRVVDAFFRKHGILRVRDAHALAQSADLYLKDWHPRGRRLVIISNSGASCVMGADASEDLKLPLAVLQPGTRAALGERLPGFANTNNPIDITAALLSNSKLFGEVLPIVGNDPAADLIFINIPVAGTGYDLDTMAGDAAKFAADSSKPVVVCAWQPMVAGPFRKAGLPTYAYDTEALGALAQFVTHRRLMQAKSAAWPAQAPLALPPGKDQFLNEAESLALLAGRNMSVVPHRLCRSTAEARKAFAELGGPLAVKACSADIPHKSEHGLVALGVDSAEDAAAIFERQWQTIADLKARQDGVLLARMHKGRREFMVGGRIDPIFGVVVMVGDGGKYVEALKDFALLLPPFGVAEVKEALQGLRIAPLLGGVRGEAPFDLDALAGIAIEVGKLLEAAGGAIASIDINPVMLGSAGEGAMIVDALVERSGALVERTGSR